MTDAECLRLRREIDRVATPMVGWLLIWLSIKNRDRTTNHRLWGAS